MTTQTEIIANGSKWNGQAPDSIYVLKENLKKYTLVNNGKGFPTIYKSNFDKSITCFSGNFCEYSACFRINTNDVVLIKELKALIAKNKRTFHYINQAEWITKDITCPKCGTMFNFTGKNKSFFKCPESRCKQDIWINL